MIFPALLLVVFLLLPWPLMEKLRAIGRTVCMLRPDHSYFLAGEQLPLEARTMGIYAGLLIALVYLLLIGRRRAIRLPPWPLIVILMGFIVVMGIDGLNSTAHDIGLPHLYVPSNLLRLVTGLLTGVAIAPFILLAVNATLWQESESQAVLGGFGELLGLLIVEALFFLGVVSGAPWLLYPVSFISAGGVVATFFAITLAVVVGLSRSRHKISSGWDLLFPINIALLLTVAELGLLLAYKLWIHQCLVQS
jgi:uncharacterized membrane protein